jgi:hypothetical protein
VPTAKLSTSNIMLMHPSDAEKWEWVFIIVFSYRVDSHRALMFRWYGGADRNFHAFLVALIMTVVINISEYLLSISFIDAVECLFIKLAVLVHGKLHD